MASGVDDASSDPSVEQQASATLDEVARALGPAISTLGNGDLRVPVLMDLPFAAERLPLIQLVELWSSDAADDSARDQHDRKRPQEHEGDLAEHLTEFARRHERRDQSARDGISALRDVARRKRGPR